jgi:hypothetical protein
MKNIAILLIVAAVGCTAAAPRIDVTRWTAHFDVAGADDRLVREAEGAWALLSEALEFEPARATLVAVADQAAFDATAPEAAGAQGVYRRRGATVITFPQEDGAVIRHEVAHHFAVALVGELSPAVNEGIAEVLEGVTRIGGRAVVPIVSAGHLDRLLAGGIIEGAAHRAHRHSHVDYSGAWARVAVALQRGEGTLRERLLRLKQQEPGLPTEAELLAAAGGWERELASILRHGDLAERASAARVLGRLGSTPALKAAFETERFGRVRIAIAGALARNGEKAALREVLPVLDCHEALEEASRSAGREFGSASAVAAWVE